jgi:tRNA(fMet)-specific endonuclease VapC
VERLIVDTGVLVALERGIASPDEVLPDAADIAIASITASELLVGVTLADDGRKGARRTTVDAVLAAFDVLAFDLETARHHAALMAHAHRSGRPRGAHDLQIAATARATSRVILTTDEHAFEDLPGVSYRLVSSSPQAR